MRERLRHRAGRFGLALVLALSAAQHPHGQQRTPAPPLPRLDTTTEIPLDLFKVPDGLEVTLWAASPLLRNPTNIDIDKDGRIWVAEGVRYRSHHARQPEGDRIVVLQDTDGDGKADSTHTFVQEPALIAPLGVSVIDNKIVVSQPPDLIVYTDVDRNLRFDPAVDKREVLLTGFQGINHDHSLHSVTVGPDGKWVFNSGNMGGDVHGPIGQDVPHLQRLSAGARRPVQVPARPGEVRGQAERRRACVRRRVHGAHESRRHAASRSSDTTTATATSSRSRRSATSSRTTTTIRRRAA